MPWWGWIVIGTLLFCAELFAIDAQFFLIFVGSGAIIVGLTGLLGVELPVWGQWLLFAVLSVMCMVMFRRRLYDKIRGNAAPVSNSVVGGRIVLEQELQPGATGQAAYRGSTWTVVNDGPQPIPAGGNAKIESMDGFTLRVVLTQP